MTTRKQVLLLVSACAMIILLSGMAIISSQATPVATASRTTVPATSPLPPDSPTTLETINPVIGVIIFLAIIATSFLVAWVAKGGMTKKAGAVGGWFTNLVTSVGGNKFWTVALLIGLYLLILIAVRQLRPDIWHWLEKPGWFFFLWLVIGLPTAIAIVNAKLKFGWALALAWLVITLFAADWRPVKEWIKRHEAAAENRMAGTPSASRSLVTTKTIVATPDKFSDFIWIPPHHNFEWETSDCVEIKNRLGRIYNYCPGQKLHLGDNLSPEKVQLAFRSATECDVDVEVVWRPK